MPEDHSWPRGGKAVPVRDNLSPAPAIRMKEGSGSVVCAAPAVRPRRYGTGTSGRPDLVVACVENLPVSCLSRHEMPC